MKKIQDIISILMVMLSITLFITGLMLNKELKQQQTIIDKQQQTIDEQQLLMDSDQLIIKSLKQHNQELEQQLSELTDKMEILVTFKDAGFNGRTVDDIRQLLELADNIPYGSPFKSGHSYTSYYGRRDETTYGGQPNGHHKGVDIVPKDWSDQTIRATANGQIVDFGESTVLGKYIVFETNTGYRIKYAHLRTIFWQDTENQIVKGVNISKGDRLGLMGSTGTWSTGPHLHFELHVYNNDTETYTEVNPWRIIEYIGGTMHDA